MSSVAKIIELIGIYEKGWEDAAHIAIIEAKNTQCTGFIALKFRT